ncbi:MAG: CYTH domain-containing protein [Patescibacteria group bacterium]
MKFKLTILLLTLIGLLIVQPLKAAENTLRIEQEGKLLVPQEKANEVWQWLRKNYIDNHEVLNRLDPTLTVYANEENFRDNYFDTPTLQLLNKQNSVRHRQRENLTNPEDRKSGRELVQIKLSNISDNQLNRGEYKFEVDLAKGPAPDKNLLVGIIKKGNQRDDFISRLMELNIKPDSLRPILIVNDFRQRIYFEKDSKPYISISFDQVTVKRWWAKVQFTEIEPELNEITYTDNDEAGRKEMERINREIIASIKQQFPEIVTDLAPKYNKAFNGLEKKIPGLRWLIRWGLL